MNRTGFTTTIPLEILVAAGRIPVDLNNLFISGGKSQELIEAAEAYGFPRNICGWIKGIFGSLIESGIREIIAVTEGDCSNTRALMEVLSLYGIRTVPFAYPHDRDPRVLRGEIERLMAHFGVDWDRVNQAGERLEKIRKKIREIDRLTWREGLVSGQENHYFQVASSDMNGSPEAYEAEVDQFLRELSSRTPFREEIRLAYIGVPPIIDDLYPFIETHGARVVFNETQRQFAMPYGISDLVERYRAYTYPYDIFFRLADIRREIAARGIHGMIHYVQSFCFRQIEDMVVRQQIDLPILTLEGDKPGPLDARSKIRIESFLELLGERI
ncbi:MAG TPA: 2-hydroxyacyl-CoA dehydratase family protein [Geobacteraceae bacterium]|mgnify:CR=1 FL=1|nr:2-hydroxyacyl-CoA dehydratase family protein [Geobacteraceae bacterium]